MLQISYFVDGLSVMSILFYLGFQPQVNVNFSYFVTVYGQRCPANWYSYSTASKCYTFPNVLQFMGSVVPLTGIVTRQQVNVTLFIICYSLWAALSQ